jgi:hypothetical protein
VTPVSGLDAGTAHPMDSRSGCALPPPSERDHGPQDLATGSSHRLERPKVRVCVAPSGLLGRSPPRVPSCCLRHARKKFRRTAPPRIPPPRRRLRTASSGTRTRKVISRCPIQRTGTWRNADPERSSHPMPQAHIRASLGNRTFPWVREIVEVDGGRCRRHNPDVLDRIGGVIVYPSIVQLKVIRRCRARYAPCSPTAREERDMDSSVLWVVVGVVGFILLILLFRTTRGRRG